MANEVRIIVRTQDDSQAGYDSAQRRTEEFAERAATTFRERFAQRLAELGQRIAAPITQAGQDIGNRLGDETGRSMMQRFRDRIRSLHRDVDTSARDAGDRIGRTIGDRVGERVSRDVDERLRRGGGGDGGGRNGAPSGGLPGADGDDPGGFLSRLLGRFRPAGSDAAEEFGGGFLEGLRSFLTNSPIGNVVLGGLGALTAGLGGVILSVVSSAVTSGIMLGLGKGVLQLGITAAFKDPMVAAAGKDLKNLLNSIFLDFGKPFRGPVLDVMESFARFLQQIRPQIMEIAEMFAPLVRDLGQGVIGALQNALPGILDAVRASAPFIEVLADRLPQIGQFIGDFFRRIAGQGDDAAVFFNDLITLVLMLIRVLSDVIAMFTSWYSGWRNIFTGIRSLFTAFIGFVIGIFGRILEGARIAFSWIPGLGEKIGAAKAQFTQMRAHINREMGQVKDKTVTIRMRVMGLAAANAAADVGRQLAAMGYQHGGIRGAQDGATRTGLTWVGEAGPELVNLPAGSRVHTAGDSRRMAGMGGGGSLDVRLIADRTTERGLVDLLMSMLRAEVISAGGGNVQTALGR